MNNETVISLDIEPNVLKVQDSAKKYYSLKIHSKKKMNYLKHLLYHFKLLTCRQVPCERDRTKSPLKVFVTTWNCGDFKLGSLVKEPWLQDSLSADIVAIGMQESRLDYAFSMITSFYLGYGLVQVENSKMWQVVYTN